MTTGLNGAFDILARVIVLGLGFILAGATAALGV
jgi:hypothetical protein